MKILRAALIAGLVATGSARAEPVTVRSGEHGVFTRLVIAKPAGTTWNLVQTGRSAELRIDAGDISFDLSRVFSRISRTRLAAIEQKMPGAPLRLILGCDCKVSSFQEGGRLIVLDIREGEVPRNSRAISLPTVFEDHLTPSLPVPRPRQDADRSTPVATSVRPDQTPRGNTKIDLSGPQDRLVRHIALAADQGLLTPGPRMVPSNQSRPEIASQAVADGIRVVSALEVAGQTMPTHEQSHAQSECVPPEFLEFYDIEADLDMTAQIASERQRLFGEFDKVNQDAAIRLARTYLTHGYGAEARQVLRLLPSADEQADILSAIASLIDEDRALPLNPFAGQQGCEGDAAFWSVLAAPDIPPGTNRNEVIQTISNLPQTLRTRLGPRISSRFADAGETETAGSIMRSIARLGVSEQPAIELAEAVLADKTDRPKAAAEGYRAVAESASDQAVQAIIRLVDKHYADGTPVSSDTLALLDGLALQYRKTEYSPDLDRAQILAQAMSGDIAGAAEKLGSLPTHPETEEHLKTVREFLDLVERTADDVSFLKLTLKYTGRADVGISPDLQFRLSARLLDLGFPDLAENVLKRQTSYGEPREHRLLRAKIAVAQILPHKAMVTLLGMQGAEVSRLRALAMTLADDRVQAAELLFTVDDPLGAARNLWISGDLDRIPNEGTGPYGPAASLGRSLSEPDDVPSEKPLARAGQLIGASAATRATVARMLSLLPAEDGV